ncbi:MAG: sulfatase-like hydrolase/transferase [Deltaproteobacteria bacterium]|nr:sulfatase-like hydrolase/transferase [Deltaproteobacteria bacterium]
MLSISQRLQATFAAALFASTIDILVVLVRLARGARDVDQLGDATTFVTAYLIALQATLLAALLLLSGQLAIAEVEKRLRRRLRPWALALVVGAMVAPFSLALADYLFSGAGIRRLIGYLPATVIGAGILLSLLFAVGWLVIAPKLRSLALARPRLYPLLALLLCAALCAIDQGVYNALYLPLHGLLILAAFLVLQSAFCYRQLTIPIRRANTIALLGSWLMAITAIPLLLPTLTHPVEAFIVERFAIFSSRALFGIAATTPRRRPASSHPDVAALNPPSTAAEGDLVLLTIDGFSPWRASLVAAKRPTTPFLRQLKERSLLFTRVYTPAPGTIASLLSLVSGTYHHETKQRRQPSPPLLWQRLQAQNYQLYCDLPFPETWRVHLGERARCDVNLSLARAQWALSSLTSFFRRADRRPILAMVHLLATHRPYQLSAGQPFGQQENDHYDAALLATDQLLEQLFRSAPNRLRQARWLISADHGRAFGWHGFSGHNRSLYEDQIRVPLLLVNWPGKARTIDQPISLLDITATLAGGVGESLTTTLDGKPRRDDAPILAYYRDKAALIEGDFKVIVDQATGSGELYNVVVDPKEQHNLIAQHPERFARLRRQLEQLAFFR